ncbi:MAG: signal peptidase I [Acidimicrobiales bacterium]
MRRITRVLSGGLALAVFMIAVVIIGGVVAGHWKLDTIRTGSMQPTLPIGSEVVVLPEPIAAVRPGQILVFRPPGANSVTVAHRVMTTTTTGVGMTITTKGDANPVPDQWKAFLNGARAWRVDRVLPDVGYVYAFITIPLVRLAILVLVVAGLLGLFLPPLFRASTVQSHVGRQPDEVMAASLEPNGSHSVMSADGAAGPSPEV